MANEDQNSAHLQEINEEIYKRNLELAVVNKTLSLLRKLYQISLLTLDPASLSEKISDTIRVDLNMEAVGILMYADAEDALTPFRFSTSERLSKALAKVNLTFDELKILHVSKEKSLQEVIKGKGSVRTDNLEDIFGSAADPARLDNITADSHLNTILLYPLVTQDKVIGMLFLGLNRNYETLSHFEKDSINSFNDVVAVALDKAMLYQQLQIANEQLKALDKARAEFISIASHQLRTPPATIKWYLGAVLEGDFGQLTEELRAALDRTRVANDSQISTIDDLLNASRIERGKLEFFFEKAEIEPIVRLLTEQLQPLAQMKKLTLVYTPPKEKLPDIVMDKEKVRQVVNNMIDNAIKYSKHGEIKVELKSDPENIIIAVTDSGKGIKPGEAGKLFQKYQRGADSATHATGLGLGLYVAKVIVEQHGGKIWADSPGEGKGSTFSFSIPLKSDLKATTVDLTQNQE